MLQKLEGYITQEQINAIVDIIVNQYREFDRLINSNTFQSLFSTEYASHNKSNSISWAISSAFPSGHTIANDLSVSCYKYGKGYSRPLLSNNRVKILILQSTSDLNAKYLEEFYRLNNSDSPNDQRFCIFTFSVKENRLINVSLCFANKEGVIASEELLNKEQIVLRIVA